MSEIKVSKFNFNENAIRSITSELSSELGEQLTEYVKEYVREVDAVATGSLLDSVTANVLGSGTSSLLIAIGSSDEAALAIEEGLPPGTPINVNKIKEWMRAKGLDASNIGLVNSIVNKLYKEGTDPKSPFANAYNSGGFNVIIERTIDKILENIDWVK